jgi:peptidyl-prolyl cis-trans isomerase D
MLGYLRSGNKRTKTIWWVLIVLTVASFVFGFIFLAGVGRDQASRAQITGDVGSINNQGVTVAEWQSALEEEVAIFRQRFGTSPQDRDLKAVEQQAWRKLVTRRMFAQEAKRAGLVATDNDIVNGLRNDPPMQIATSPAFQTNGQFDPTKYQQALADPRINWAPFEQLLREQIPVRKLQERLLSSIKLSEGELKQEFHHRFDRAAGTLVLVPAADTGRSAGDEAALKKAYELNRARMAAGARTQLEVLVLPKKFGADEAKAALDQARSLFDRASKGEDFAQLARDYSEGPNAERGGVIDRWIMPGELGTMIGAAVQAKKPGELIEPVQEGSRVLLLKILDPARDSLAAKQPAPGPGAVRLAQIILRVQPSPEALQAQYKEAKALADRARATRSLSKTATEKGLQTFKTGYFDQNNAPPQLAPVPEAADWGLTAKKDEVGPVFESSDEFVIVQCAMQHLAGPPTREELGEQLKLMADAEARVDMAKARADAIAAAIKSGQTLEAAAAAAGLTAVPVTTNRVQPDPRLAVAPEIIGMLYGAPAGKVVGPVRTAQGWMFARVEGVTATPDSLFNDQVKGQITNDVLSRRQRGFFDGFIEKLRSASQVADLRGGRGN